MKRAIGACSWIFAGEPLTETAQRLRRAGMDGVELHGDIAGLAPDAAASVLADAGLSFFSITPGDGDLSHPQPAMRNRALDYYEALLDWAAAIRDALPPVLVGDGRFPQVGCHGQVGRVRVLSDPAREDAWLAEALQRICTAARARGLGVVFELLNRYESHQVNSVAAGLVFVDRVGADNLTLLPDAYHMNIEEADPGAALAAAGTRIGLYHCADSNRGAVGDGHIDFAAQFAALTAAGYDGPIVLEPAAPGPDPFNPDKGTGFRDVLERQLVRSRRALRALGA